jgi:hypothetical protein
MLENEQRRGIRACEEGIMVVKAEALEGKPFS